MTKKTTSTDLAKSSPSSSALAFGSSFDDLFGDLPADEIVTGLEEADSSDFKFRLKVMNFKGKLKTGKACPVDAFFDTQSEEAQESIDAHFLSLHKSREWREYNEKESRSVIKCRSMDGVEGVLEDGRVRSCKGCPDYEWHQTAEGKRKRNCSDVYNLVGVESVVNEKGEGISLGEFFLVRFKKTALAPLKQYLSANFLNKRRLPGGKLAHMPFYAFGTRVHLKVADNGNYSTPVFERGAPVQDRGLIQELMALASTVKVDLPAELEKAVERDQESDSDTSDRPNPNDFRDDDYGSDVPDAELVDDTRASSVSGKQSALGADF